MKRTLRLSAPPIRQGRHNIIWPQDTFHYPATFHTGAIRPDGVLQTFLPMRAPGSTLR